MSERLVLVTGASGVLGRRVVRALRVGGWRTRALVHRTAAPDADEELHGSLEDVASLARATAGVDAVVHLAALTHSRDSQAYFQVNAEGTAAVVRAAEEAGVERFVHVSTRAISPEGGSYSVSKLRAEEAVAAAGVRFVILRLAEVYGGGGREGVDRLVAAARADSIVPIVGRGDDELCPIHIDDAAAAVVGALDAPVAVGRRYTIGGECLTVREFAVTCRSVLGGGRAVPVPTPLLRVAAAAARVVPIPLYPDQLARLQSPKERPTPGAEEELGFRVRRLEEGLRATD